MSFRNAKTAIAGAQVGLLMSAAALYAEPVTLTSAGGGISLTGEIIEYDGTRFRISSKFGEIDVQADMVTCVGAACPVIAPAFSSFQVAGSQALTRGLIPSLVVGYGASIDASTGMARTTDGLPAYQVATPQGSTVEIAINPSTSRGGMDALLADQAMFAVTTRAAHDVEIAAAQESGLGDMTSANQEQVVAVDALLLVAHPDNPVRAITEANAARVFSGEITNWSELGWRDAPITLYAREADSGTREVFENLVMAPNKQSFTDNVTVLGSDRAVAEAIKNDPTGFGVTNFGQAAGVSTLAVESVCGLRTPANEFTIKTGEYSLTRLMYMYQTDAALTGHARGFADFVASSAGQDTITQAGFVNQSIVAEAINAQGVRIGSAVMNSDTPETMDAMRDMMRILLTSERLSTTYRFRDGTVQLDDKSMGEVHRLADLLVTEDYQNRNVYFLGFSDSIGRADLNQLLALQRAEQVRLALLDVAPELEDRIKSRAVGYGELSPIGCNETKFGRNINRRVEVWVQDIAMTDAES